MTDDHDGDELMTTAEISRVFRVNPKTVLRWRKEGVLQGIKPGGRFRFWRSDVERLLELDEDDGAVLFLLWSNRHNAWYRSHKLGFTSNVDEAGRYTQGQATRIVVESAMCMDRTQVTCMVAAPLAPARAQPRAA